MALTELRLYAVGIILWLGVVFVWFLVTVLRGRRSLFAVGALVAGFAATAALNVANPDALIARTNLDRPRVDVAYVAGLSDDAVPALLQALPSLRSDLRQALAVELLQRSESGGDWRSFNLARARASSLLAAHHRELLEIGRAVQLRHPSAADALAKKKAPFPRPFPRSFLPG
jgi:two-component system, OmpR family, sensor histidine kinase BaeS